MNEDKTEKESPLQLLQKWLRKRRQNQQVIKHFGKDIDTIVKEAKQNLLRKNRERGIPDDIEGYYEKFKQAPLGRWSSSFDHGPWPTDAWEFHADGRGRILQYSGSGNKLILFQWQPKAERTILFHVTDRGETNWDDEEEENEQEHEDREASDDEPIRDTQDTPDTWGTMVYDFKIIDHFGPTIVMFQVPEDATSKFWLTLDYLQFVGDITAED